MMNRDESVARIEDLDQWDVLIIGGGATGLGAAVESATRGYRTLLLEKSDFAKGTSSRSTKLVHGGVRYLQQGNVSLVLEALRERGRMIQNAPHLVRHLPFVVPNYDWWEGPFYGVGLKIYDMMAGRLGLGPSKFLSRDETLRRIPTIEPDGLRGGIAYFDGQFDDARLAITLALTADDHGATLANYVEVVGLLNDKGIVSGVIARDVEADREFEIHARVVINATGVFTDDIRKMDEPGIRPMLTASQGIHFVLDRSFLPGDSAIMIPRTEDKRVLFAVPWHDRIVLGTTDTPVKTVELEPRPLESEIAFLMEHAAKYLTKDPSPSDVLSAFAGLRPLVSAAEERGTSSISRDHTIVISTSGLVTITGGKWTTYRKMAQDVIDQAIVVADLRERPSVTADMRLHGYSEDRSDGKSEGAMDVYGSDVEEVREAIGSIENGAKRIHESLPYLRGEVAWAARREMARTVDDVLSRRTRALILDARAARASAGMVAEILADELRKDSAWVDSQRREFETLADRYILPE
jgi:glycerol-3-phosphate dehydrogenase